MSTISTQLRNFKEPTKEQLTEIFFSIPPAELQYAGSSSPGEEKLPHEEPLEKMEINAVLSLGVQGEEDSYVSTLLSIQSYMCMNLMLHADTRQGNCISYHHISPSHPWTGNRFGLRYHYLLYAGWSG